MKVSVFSIIEELRTTMSAKFNDYVDEISKEAGFDKDFTIGEFYTKSLRDVLVGHDDFGIIYHLNSVYPAPLGVNETITRETVNIAIEVVILDRGDVLRQLSLVAKGIARTLTVPVYDFRRYCGLKIQTTAPSQFDPRASSGGDLQTQFISAIIISVDIGG